MRKWDGVDPFLTINIWLKLSQTFHINFIILKLSMNEQIYLLWSGTKLVIEFDVAEQKTTSIKYKIKLKLK